MYTELSTISSLKAGGKGEIVQVHNEEEMKAVCLYANDLHKKMRVIGGGTNTYFGEDLGTYVFVSVQNESIHYEESDDENVYVSVGASVIWDSFACEVAKKGLWGIENLSFIPGLVGATPVQNIGAYGVEVGDYIHEVLVYDREEMKMKTLTQKECLFSYRDSLFKQNAKKYIVYAVTFLLSKKRNTTLQYAPLNALNKEVVSLEEIRNEVIRIRKEKLPDYKEHYNAGSFFKNPVVSKEEGDRLRIIYETIPFFETGKENDRHYKVPAAWLIEHVAQMKGVTIGNMSTWKHQPLVLVSNGKAKAKEIDDFAESIEHIVFEKTGIALKREVEEVA